MSFDATGHALASLPSIPLVLPSVLPPFIIPPFHVGVSLAVDEGSELLGVFLAVGLWGITCVQTIYYFIHFPDDRINTRAMVAWLWLADSAHQTLLIKGVYEELITNFCDYNQVLKVNVEYLWQVLLTVLVALPAQLFFVNRIAKFSGKRWLPFALWVPAAMFELGGVLVFIAFGTITPTSEELVSRLPSIMFTTVQSTATVIDMSITSGLIFLLWRSREDAQYRLRTVIHRLLILSLSTGVWTSLFSILTVITMFAFPSTLIYVGLYFPLCPLYCNTVLVNLNARQVIEKLERRPTRESITLYRETDSTTRIVPTRNSPVINHGEHELAEAQTLRCRCQSETSRHDVEAGVQTTLNTAVVV